MYHYRPPVGRRSGGIETGYTPVDPFKPSIVQGVNNVLGGTRDRTIDDIYVLPPFHSYGPRVPYPQYPQYSPNRYPSNHYPVIPPPVNQAQNSFAYPPNNDNHPYRGTTSSVQQSHHVDEWTRPASHNASRSFSPGQSSHSLRQHSGPPPPLRHTHHSKESENLEPSLVSDNLEYDPTVIVARTPQLSGSEIRPALDTLDDDLFELSPEAPPPLHSSQPSLSPDQRRRSPSVESFPRPILGQTKRKPRRSAWRPVMPPLRDPSPPRRRRSHDDWASPHDRKSNSIFAPPTSPMYEPNTTIPNITKQETANQRPPPDLGSYRLGASTIPGRDSPSMTWLAVFLGIVLDLVPRQIYIVLLLRLPALYWSRVTRIFQDANLGMNEIKRMALEAANSEEATDKMLVYQGVFPREYSEGSVSYTNLRTSWYSFIDSLMREWKTFNIISVLLLSAILTILQINSAAANPLTRYSALLSLVCAFMSLLYGCIYIIRFGSMRKTHKAAEWANESEKSRNSIFWNVWVMLAMPAVWLAWSMIAYIICIMSFVWQTGTVSDQLAPTQDAAGALIPRIIISAVLGLGFVYLILIGFTFQRYGDPMEAAWRQRIRGWLEEKERVAQIPTWGFPPATTGGWYDPVYRSRDAKDDSGGAGSHREPDNFESKNIPRSTAGGWGIGVPLPRPLTPKWEEQRLRTTPEVIPLNSLRSLMTPGGVHSWNTWSPGIREPRSSVSVPGSPGPSSNKGIIDTSRTKVEESRGEGNDLLLLSGQGLVEGTIELDWDDEALSKLEPERGAKVLAIRLWEREESGDDGDGPSNIDEAKEIMVLDHWPSPCSTVPGDATAAGGEGMAAAQIPRQLQDQGFSTSSWNEFVEEAATTWNCQRTDSELVELDNDQRPTKHQPDLYEFLRLLDKWNHTFLPFKMHMSLMWKRGRSNLSPTSPSSALYPPESFSLYLTSNESKSLAVWVDSGVDVLWTMLGDDAAATDPSSPKRFVAVRTLAAHPPLDDNNESTSS